MTGNTSQKDTQHFLSKSTHAPTAGEEEFTFLRYPTIFYTGVTKLPLSWKLPYHRGSETQNLAFSTDGLATWHKSPLNPILSIPPHWNLTGWRDPHVFQNSFIDSLVEIYLKNSTQFARESADNPSTTSAVKEKYYFMLLGSGVVGGGGALLFHFALEPTGPFHSLPLPIFHRAWDTRVEAEDQFTSTLFGHNYEVPFIVPTNYSDPQNPSSPLFLVAFGTEGVTPHLPGNHVGLWTLGTFEVVGVEDFYVSQPASSSTKRRLPLPTLFPPLNSMSVTIVFRPISQGVVDYGFLYGSSALSRSLDVGTSTNSMQNYILLGWVCEDTLPSSERDLQSFSGVIGTPREMSLKWQAAENKFSLQTRPLSSVLRLLRRALKLDVNFSISPSDRSTSFFQPTALFRFLPCLILSQLMPFMAKNSVFYGIPFAHVEINLHFHVFHMKNSTAATSKLAVLLRHSISHQTLVTFRPHDAEIVIERLTGTELNSVSQQQILPIPYHAVKGDSTQLQLQIITDQSLIEFFVNGGDSSLSTRVYPSSLRRDCLSENSMQIVGVDVDASVKAQAWELHA